MPYLSLHSFQPLSKDSVATASEVLKTMQTNYYFNAISQNTILQGLSNKQRRLCSKKKCSFIEFLPLFLFQRTEQQFLIVQINSTFLGSKDVDTMNGSDASLLEMQKSSAIAGKKKMPEAIVTMEEVQYVAY